MIAQQVNMHLGTGERFANLLPLFTTIPCSLILDTLGTAVGFEIAYNRVLENFTNMTIRVHIGQCSQIHL